MYPPKLYIDYLYSELNRLNQNKVDNDNKEKWRKLYNNIKGHDWPALCEIGDFDMLPTAIRDECINTFNVNPGNWLNNYRDCEYHDSILDHTTKIIINNIEFINNKKIVDFACNMGLLTTMSLYNGCKHVIATDIRQENLDVLTASVNKFTNFQNITTLVSDLHDYNNNTKLAEQADTVLLCGIMYHVHDHYAILESIALGAPECIIIETLEIDDPTFINSNNADIRWFNESDATLHTLSGWYQNKKELLVGFPNSAWIEKMADHVGYSIKKKTLHTVERSDTLDLRSVYVLVKKQ